MKLGKTGDFPDGKLGPTDEGALRVGVSTKDGMVVINFGTQVAWLAMPPEQAKMFAAILYARAADLEN